MKYKINVREFLGLNYDELLLFDALYNFLETAKNAKKSTTIARILVLWVVSDYRVSHMILRKYMKDHNETTFNDIKGAFEALEKHCGYPWQKYWKFSHSSKDCYFYNPTTEQKFKFGSFDKYDSITGSSLGADSGRYWGAIWLEEPIQKKESTENGIDESEMVSDFKAIISTLFRGILPPGAKRKIFVSYNDWNPKSKFKEYYVSQYVKKNDEALEKFGKQFKYDPNAFEGQGGLWFFSGAGVNEFTDDLTRKFYKELKIYDYELYKTVVQGVGVINGGSAYGNNVSKVKVFELDKDGRFYTNEKVNNRIEKRFVKEGIMHFGIDYSSTKDETVVTCTLISKNFWDIQILDSWSYKDTDSVFKKKLTDTEQVAQIWNFIEKCLKKYKNYLVGSLNKIYIDSKDTVVRSYLNEYWKKSEFTETISKCYPASKFGIAGKNVRVFAVRMLMGMGRIRIMPHIAEKYISEWNSRVFLKNGQIKDGKDDASQSFEYSISNIFKSIFTPEQLKILTKRYQADD